MATNYVLQHSGKEIDNLLNKVSNIPEYTFQVVNELPTENINKNTVYIVQTGAEECDEYIRIGQHWEKLGSEKKLKTLSTNSIYQRGMFIYTYDPNMEMGYEAPSESTEGLPEYTFIKVSDGTELAKCSSYAHLFDYILYQVGQYISGVDTQTLTDGIYLVSPFNQDSMANLYRGSNLLGINLKWSHRANWSHKYVSTFGEESYITFSIANSKTTIYTHNYEIVLRTREAQDYDGLRLVISMNSVTPIEHPTYATETYVNTEVSKITKASLELGNVDNKSSETIRNEITKSNITTALGYTPAELDANGKVSTSQLPSYVDDVLEYSAKSSFPATGETGKIYVDLATNLTYRWSGSAYVEISPSLALGETSSTAYRGDRGKTAYDHSQVKDGSNPHATTFNNIASKPTTLSGYGITDAKIANGLITLGTNSITPLTADSTLNATKLIGLASIDTTGKASNAGTADSLKGVTATATELNYVKGVTSSIQVQLNNLANGMSSGSIPSGLICMWSGSSVPTGWALCNGANGTPDLRDRFIVGSGNLYSIGNTGGSANVSLTVAQMPSHTHTATTTTTGTHNHVLWYDNMGTTSSKSNALTMAGNGAIGGCGSAGNKYSYIDIDGDGGYANNMTYGAHSHDISVTNVGSGSPHENLPPYYALAFIMKL